MSHNSTNILRRGLLGSSVVKSIRLISEEAKGHVCKYLKTMRKSINLTLHAEVVIELVAVEVAELRDVPL